MPWMGCNAFAIGWGKAQPKSRTLNATRRTRFHHCFHDCSNREYFSSNCLIRFFSAEEDGQDGGNDKEETDVRVESSAEESSTPPFSTTISGKQFPSLPLSSLGIAIVFVMFWPLLALLRADNSNFGNPIAGFDIDMYMALKGILDDNNSLTASTTDQPTTILELPPLSPGERLVDAIFGP